MRGTYCCRLFWSEGLLVPAMAAATPQGRVAALNGLIMRLPDRHHRNQCQWIGEHWEALGEAATGVSADRPIEHLGHNT